MIVAQGTIAETIKDTCSQGLLSAMTLPLRCDRVHCAGGKNILTQSRKVGIDANFIATRAFCPTHLQPSCPSSLPFFLACTELIHMAPSVQGFHSPKAAA